MKGSDGSIININIDGTNSNIQINPGAQKSLFSHSNKRGSTCCDH